MARNYKIVGNKIIAKVGNLTDKEVAAVKNYIKLGFELEEPKKKEPNPAFKKEAIQKYLEDKGTKEQQAKYEELFNQPILDEDGKQVYTKDGKPRVKGHIATLSWFKETFPKYPNK